MVTVSVCRVNASVGFDPDGDTGCMTSVCVGRETDTRAFGEEMEKYKV